MAKQYSVFWFRRDLRLHDNHALFQALKSGREVLPLFIFDKGILEQLTDPEDKRVQFIHDRLSTIQQNLIDLGSDLLTLHGHPIEVFADLLDCFEIAEVYANEDYEPEALVRDSAVAELLASHGAELRLFKDQVIWSPTEVLKADGSPYTIFTPYSKVWKAQLTDEVLQSFPSEQLSHAFAKLRHDPLISMEQRGFKSLSLPELPTEVDDDILIYYKERRDVPSLDATSHLSVHLRFGTVSVREQVRRARQMNEQWLNELIWREFFMMILGNFPHVVTNCFKSQYEAIAWRNDAEEFDAWCNGRTGYPIVDAGMRELNATGYMHNRVRMIVASFLCKHLLIDWRWGEAYFAQKLIDYDLSANNGNWQWSAGCGCDAAPYFRIFNPTEQMRKFDAQQEYIMRWLDPDDMLRAPIVDHVMARQRCLDVYQAALKADRAAHKP